MTGLIVIVLIFAQQLKQRYAARDESTVGADDDRNDRNKEGHDRICRVLDRHRQHIPRAQKQESQKRQFARGSLSPCALL